MDGSSSVACRRPIPTLPPPKPFANPQPTRPLHAPPPLHPAEPPQKYTNESATLRVLQGGKERTVTVRLQAPVRLIPFHIKGKPPSYFIVAGLVFTAVSVPYLKR